MSTRISQEMARGITEQILQPLADNCTATRETWEIGVRDAYMACVPQAVINFSSKFPDYAPKTGTVQIDGHGFRREWVNITKPVPCNHGSGRAMLSLSEAQGKTLQRLKSEWDNAKTVYNLKTRELNAALVNLRTFKQIREYLPEAIPFLPTETTTALVPDLSKLRKELAEIGPAAKPKKAK